MTERKTTSDDPRKTCDDCGVRVSTRGYLGGGIVCNDCARAKREAYDG